MTTATKSTTNSTAAALKRATAAEAEAQELLGLATSALETARSEKRAIQDRIRECDPDSEELPKLAAELNTINAQIEAHATRVGDRQRKADAAETTREAAEIEHLEAQHAELIAEIEKRDAAWGKKVEAFARDAITEGQEMRDDLHRAHRIRCAIAGHNGKRAGSMDYHGTLHLHFSPAQKLVELIEREAGR